MKSTIAANCKTAALTAAIALAIAAAPVMPTLSGFSGNEALAKPATPASYCQVDSVKEYDQAAKLGNGPPAKRVQYCLCKGKYHHWNPPYTSGTVVVKGSYDSPTAKDWRVRYKCSDTPLGCSKADCGGDEIAGNCPSSTLAKEIEGCKKPTTTTTTNGSSGKVSGQMSTPDGSGAGSGEYDGGDGKSGVLDL
jgi:hypothetical protein